MSHRTSSTEEKESTWGMRNLQILLKDGFEYQASYILEKLGYLSSLTKYRGFCYLCKSPSVHEKAQRCLAENLTSAK